MDLSQKHNREVKFLGSPDTAPLSMIEGGRDFQDGVHNTISILDEPVEEKGLSKSCKICAEIRPDC
jgi:hypothetical protein